MMKECTSFTSKVTGKSYEIRKHFNCKSSCVIYLLECNKCGIQYVGQTHTTISKRMTSHRHDIRNKVEKSVSSHFNKETSHSLCDIRVIVIDDAPSNLTSHILRESSWIQALVTTETAGLNNKEN